MIFRPSYDKIYDHKFPVTKRTFSADRKTRKITAQCTQMKQLQRMYATEKQFRHKQSQKGAKFTLKIHKIAIDTSGARHDALTYTMTHYKAV